MTGALFFAISYLRYRTIRRHEEAIIVQEKALIQAERRLAAAMSAATVAHDLNNLLMVLSGLVEGLKGREGNDPFLLTMREEVDLSIGKLTHLAKRLVLTVRRAAPEKDDAAMLVIHDNGPGVSDDLVEDIFEPCFTTKPDGTGIGLLAVKAFAASCGTDVSVGRSPLGGAMFRLRIPIQNQPSNKEPEATR